MRPPALSVCAAALAHCAAMAAGGQPGRDVVCRVLDVDGKPCAGVMVGLLGLASEVNREWPSEPAHEPTPAGWRFVSDKDGYVTAHLGEFLSYEHQQATHEMLPGWGSFYLVATRKGRAGAVSPRIDNYPEKDIEGLKPPDPSVTDAWSTGKIVRLVQPRTEVEMQFVRGVYVKGQMLRDDGKPDVNRVIDLGDPHEGWLRHAFHEFTRGGPHGEFDFYHAYPAPFEVTISRTEGSSFWKRTRLRGQSFEEPVALITPRPGEKEIDLIIQTSHVPYRYFGKVSGPDGKGIHGAQVSITLSPVPGGEGRPEKATSDSEGAWYLETGTPFAHDITIVAPGFKPWTMTFPPDAMPKERRYDCTLVVTPP